MALIISHKLSPRREGGSQRGAYGVLLFGALCMSTWVLLSHQLSVALPLAHAPFGASLPCGQSSSRESSSSSSSSSSLVVGRPASTLQQLMADLRPHATTAEAAAAVAAGGGRLAGGNGSSGERTLLMTFQRSKTAMSFLMVTCRMCSSPVAADLDAWRLHAPVTSTLLESVISNTQLEERVIVDVGAGLGYFTMLAAAWGSKVVAFEPDAWARDVLAQNAALVKDGRVKVVPYAAGAVTRLPDDQPAAASSNTSTNATASSSSSSNSTTSSSQVVVVKLSEAISSDVAISTLVVDGSCQQQQQQQGATLPDFEAVMEGAYDMLGRVQWLFIPSLCESSSARVKALLHNILVRGNFSHVYAYDEDTQPVAEDDEGVEQQQAAMPTQAEQHQQEAAGIVAAPAAAAPAPSQGGAATAKSPPRSSLPYPADAHLQDVTQPVRTRRADAVFAANLVFARTPLGGTLTIQMPKPLVWTDIAALGADTNRSQMMDELGQLQQQLPGGGAPAQTPDPTDPPERPAVFT